MSAGDIRARLFALGLRHTGPTCTLAAQHKHRDGYGQAFEPSIAEFSFRLITFVCVISLDGSRPAWNAIQSFSAQAGARFGGSPL